MLGTDVFNVGGVIVVVIFGTNGDVNGLDGIVVVGNGVDGIGFCLFLDK